jgi:hypothetical protein
VLQHFVEGCTALRGRELPDDEMRRVAEQAWRHFLRYGWPRT